MKKIYLLVPLVILLFAVAACNSPAGGGGAPSNAEQTVTSMLSQEQALEMGENALQAINSGDYAAWSRDWSDTMKKAINEKTFQTFRDATLRDYGRYQSIAEVRLAPGRTSGTTRWEFITHFEKGDLLFYLAFYENSVEVDGVNLSPYSGGSAETSKRNRISGHAEMVTTLAQ